MKYIFIDFHFIRDQVIKSELHVSHVYTYDQLVYSLSLSQSHLLIKRSIYITLRLTYDINSIL